MEKLLHEWLREQSNKGLYIQEAAEVFGLATSGKSYYDMFNDLLSTIDDEIERYYIPRPRFEDGEPVQWGELFRGFNGEECDLAAFTVSSDGHYLLNEYSGDCDFSLKSYNDFAKRPTPKVYDADGVEIKVGQNRWDTKSGIEITVSRFIKDDDGRTIVCANGDICELQFEPGQLTHERPVFDAEGVRICKGDEGWCTTIGAPCKVVGDDKRSNDLYVEWTDSEYTNSWIKADYFTHREPDSSERIIHDICEYCKLGSTDACDAAEFLAKIADRAALIERGA